MNTLEAGQMVYVVDDDPSVRTALGRLLTASGYRVQLFALPQEFLEFPRPELPCCLVLDIRMPGLSGLDVQTRLQHQGAAVPIIFVTAHGTVSDGVRAMKGGACDFLEKPFEDHDLLEAVASALTKSRSAHDQQRLRRHVLSCFASLSPREKEVYSLVVQGIINRRIADQLGTTEKTIKVHRGRVMEKMGAASLADLVRMAEIHALFPSGQKPAIGL